MVMNINADFSKRIVVHSEQLDWLPSPVAGVSRRMLDRIGDEVARATSIVKYDPGSRFSAHVHTGGEEFIVLEGVFQDEHGDYPAGSYVRNPPQSSHTPGSAQGCVIFVKLWQFDLKDRKRVRLNMDKATGINAPDRPGITYTPLHHDEHENVVMECWEPGTSVKLDLPGGAELLVLDGEFEDDGDLLSKHSWLRIPPGGNLSARTGMQGARVWIKTGHLQFVSAPK